MLGIRCWSSRSGNRRLARDQEEHEARAVRGVSASVLGMIRAGATHVGVATDHIIESFRDEMDRKHFLKSVEEFPFLCHF
jgi:hypothetical protein